VQRWLKFTKYLPEFGITPVIYTARDAEYAVIDRSLEKQVSRDLEVIRGKILEPNRWLGRLSGKPKQSSAGFLDAKPSFSDRFLRYIRANFFIPDARRFWIRPSVEFLSRYLKQNDIDLIITTGPPHSVHLIGLALKKEFGLPWVADFRDPWTSIDYFGSLPLSHRALEKHRRLEKEVLSSADRVVVVGEQMRKEFLKYNSHVKVIANGYDTEEGAEEVGLDPEFTLTYAGLMNADRNPQALWKVLGELVKDDPVFAQDLKLRFVGSCSMEVLESLDENGLTAHMEDLGYLDHEQVSLFQRSAQVLLLTVNQVASAQGIVTGKIFEYMRAGRPVLAIGPTDGDLATIIGETRCGTVVDFQDESGLKRSVLELYRKFKKGILEVNPVNIEKYHRRNLTRELSVLLEEIDGIDKRENSKS
jgi:glycosyltransferase involved in cell wall biosynthesis